MLHIYNSITSVLSTGLILSFILTEMKGDAAAALEYVEDLNSCDTCFGFGAGKRIEVSSRQLVMKLVHITCT